MKNLMLLSMSLLCIATAQSMDSDNSLYEPEIHISGNINNPKEDVAISILSLASQNQNDPKPTENAAERYLSYLMMTGE